MAKLWLDEELWSVIEPLLPPEKVVGPQGGHPWVPHRPALKVILYVLKSGIAWEDVPKEMGCSGVTAWRRLRDWQQQGVWEKLHREMLNRLGAKGRIDWSRASIDGSSVPAPKGGPRRGRTRRIGRRPALRGIW